MNRFDPENLWNMQDDARAECTAWRCGAAEDAFAGVHHGYRRLGVNIQRNIRLDKESCTLEIADVVDGHGHHEVTVPFHLAPDVSVERPGTSITLRSA